MENDERGRGGFGGRKVREEKMMSLVTFYFFACLPPPPAMSDFRNPQSIQWGCPVGNLSGAQEETLGRAEVVLKSSYSKSGLGSSQGSVCERGEERAKDKTSRTAYIKGQVATELRRDRRNGRTTQTEHCLHKPGQERVRK